MCNEDVGIGLSLATPLEGSASVHQYDIMVRVRVNPELRDAEYANMLLAITTRPIIRYW